MKRLILLLALTAYTLSFISVQKSYAQAGIFQTYVALNFDGSVKHFQGGETSNNHRTAEDFNGQYLGTFNSNDVFELAGGEIHSWKSGDNINAADLFYSIYKVGSSGTFTEVDINYCCDQGNSDCASADACTTISGTSTNQRWSTVSGTTDILAGLDPGDYTIQVYFRISTDSSGDFFDSDNVNGDYQANFTVGTEGFSDGDLTSGVVWSGETSSYSIVDPESDTGTGLNSNINGSGIENNHVLVSNASAPDAVITTPSEMAYGTWQFSFATSDGFAPSSQNSLKAILISDESDVAKLKDGSYDFNGYMIEAGQNGATDHIRLIKVEGSTKTNVITTAYPGTATFDLGYRVKVVRERNGDWEIFAEEGFDGLEAATSIGTGNDNDVKTSSFFAFTTELSGNANNRIYYDNLSLSPNTTVSFASDSSVNNETDGTVSVNVNLINPSLETATTLDVLLTKGDAFRIDNYTTQSFTFPAGSSASQTLTINISDNNDCDFNTNLVLEIQNVTGGINAESSEQNTFSIQLNDDNTSSENDINDDFEDGDLVGVSGDTSDFTNEITTELNGAQALFTDATDALDGAVSVHIPNNIKDIKGATTTWRFSFALGLKDPNRTNRFMYHLTSSSADPLDANLNGYAVGVNAVLDAVNQDAGDDIKLYKITNGFATELINHNIPNGIGSFESWAIEVVRLDNGNWELLVNSNKDFSDLTSVGNVTDTDYEFMGDVVIASYKGQENGTDTNWQNWEIWFDDISVTQEFCSGTYETTASGAAVSANWQLVGTTTPVTPPFNKYTDIIVKDGDVLTLNEDIRTASVTIESGGEIDLSMNHHQIEIFEDLTIDGTLTPQKGSISMIGNTGAQSVAGSATPEFYEFNVDNTDGVIMNTDAKFFGPIHPEKGTLAFGTQNITLASADINGEILTGSISQIKDAADVTGSVTMERYVSSTEDGYRLIGIPVNNQTVSSAFSGDFALTGFTGSDYPNHYFTNLKYYSEPSHSATSINVGFMDVMNVTDAINPELGYWAYFPEGTNNYTLDATGEFNKGDITINLDYTDTGNPNLDGWNCIANPYPADIDMASTDIIFTNCERASYILDHTLGTTWKGEYSIFDDGTTINGGSNLISSYQAFFVKATGPNASITFSESAKVDAQAAFLRLDDLKPEIRLSINSESNKYETVISFHDEASNEYDPDFDAYFLESNHIDDGALTLSSLLDDVKLSINTFTELDSGISIPLEIITPLEGEYILRLDALQNIPTSVCLILEDTESNEFTQMEEGTEIILIAPQDNYGTQKYVLHAYPGVSYTSVMTSCYGSDDGFIELSTPDYGSWQINWLDENGENIASDSGVPNMNLASLTSGIYTVVLTDENEMCSTISEEIIVFEPAPEEALLNGSAAECDLPNAEINSHIANANEWTISVFEENNLVAENTGNSNMAIQDLYGRLYTVQLNSECISEEYVLDLRDPNRVISSFESDTELILQGGVASFSAINSSQNEQLNQWYVNEELVSEAIDLDYEFYLPGEYEVTLVGNNNSCSDAFSRIIAVSMADNIEQEKVEFSIQNLGTELAVNSSSFIQDIVIQVFDVSGKLVINEKRSGSFMTIPTVQLSKGTYVLQLILDNETLLSEKFMN